jgi:hypothetical protein
MGLLATLGAAFAHQSDAHEITFVFTGTVDYLERKDCEDVFDSSVAVGDTITGSFTFDSDAVGTDLGWDGGGLWYPTAIKAGSFIVGKLTTAGESGSITFVNDYVDPSTPSSMNGHDIYDVTVAMPGTGCTVAREMSLRLDDATGKMLLDNCLPTTPPALPAGSDQSGSRFTIRIEHDALVCGVVTSLTLFSPDPDVTPPTVMSVSVTPSVLWPPNGQMVSVTVMADITDDSGVGSATLIEDDEYNQFDREVPMALDATTGLWKATIQLKAERYGTDKTDGGRVYYMPIRATDSLGNASVPSTAGATVLVPHSQGKSKK